MESKNVIVISFDALSSSDLDKLSKMNNFAELIKNGSIIKNVQSIFPSLTYPAHATIMTGKYPNEHGVISNDTLKLNDNKLSCYRDRKNVNVDTVYGLALKKGLTVASILWPVTDEYEITYNIPKTYCDKPYYSQIIKSALSRNLFYQYSMNKRFGAMKKGMSEPMFDDFSVEVAKATIKEKKPNLLLLNLMDVYFQKSNYGNNSQEVYEALERHDRRLGEIVNTLKECRQYDDTTIILLGDCNFVDVKYAVRLNSLFRKEGLITVVGNDIHKYKVIAKSCDGSSYIYCTDKKYEDEVYRLLKMLQEEKDSPIKNVYSDNDIIASGADIRSSFIVEAKKGYYFVDGYDGDFVCEAYDLKENECKIKSCKGYINTAGDEGTFFIASGKNVKKGVVIEGGRLINHGPTIAKILGLNLEDSTGIVEERILSGEERAADVRILA